MGNRLKGNRGQRGSLEDSAKNLCFIAMMQSWCGAVKYSGVSTTSFSYKLFPIAVTSRCGGSHCRTTAAWSLHVPPAAPLRVLQLPHTVQRCARWANRKLKTVTHASHLCPDAARTASSAPCNLELRTSGQNGYSRQPLLLHWPCKIDSFRNLLSGLFFFFFFWAYKLMTRWDKPALFKEACREK